MRLTLNIVRDDGEPLPPGSGFKVEIRDTSLADAAAVTLKVAHGVVPRAGRAASMPIVMEFVEAPMGSTVWAHVDTNGDGRVSSGDFVSAESYPVTPATRDLTVRVKKVT